MRNQKKKQWKRAVGVFCFLLAGVLLFDRISFLVRRKTGQESDMMNVIYTVEKNSADVVILGTSHGYWGVQNNLLWGEYGISSMSACSAAQTVATSYYALKEVLKYQKPKVVLLESYYFYYNGKYYRDNSNSALRKAIDGLRSVSLKKELLDDFFPEMSWKEKLVYYIPFIRFHSRWNDLRNYDFNVRHFLRGSKLGYGIVPTQEQGIPEEPSEIPEVNRTYFDKIEALCEENGISLVVFAVPYGCEKNMDKYMQKQGVNVALESYLEEKGIPFLFYQKTGEVDIDFSHDLHNPTHLNSYGAQKITRHLGKWLQENYDLEDHRGDPVWSSYAEDYEKYLAWDQYVLENGILEDSDEE